MKLYVARHGRTNYNDQGLCNADPAVEVHLTEVGTEQSTELSKKLKDIPIDHIFVSELGRTQQTADIVNENHQAPTTIDSRLNDNRSGYEGQPWREYYAALDGAKDRWTVCFNDGESLEDVKTRVKSFLDELQAKDYGTVLIVTSLVIVQAICGILRGLSNQEAWDLPVEQGSCLELNL